MYKRFLLFTVCSLIAFLAVSGNVAALRPAQSSPAEEPFTMALVGDAMVTEHLSPYKEPEFLSMIDLIRNADVSYANLEMLLHDWEGYPNAQNGGMYMRADPKIAKELAWAGFRLMSLANNHTGDFSPEVVRLTGKYL